MLRSDAKSNLLVNISTINLDLVAAIEKDVDVDDLVSLVFLLYKSPDVALERLTIFLRVYKDLGEKDFNLLQDWAQQNQSSPIWRNEFLEALTICQLYKVVRKLGFQVPVIKQHYLPNDLRANFYINPMKKALYKLCEHVTVDNHQRLKNTLHTYEIDINTEDFCELTILDLMCKRFITVDKTATNGKYDIEEFAKVIENFPQINKFANILRELQKKLNGDFSPLEPSPSNSNIDLTKPHLNKNKITPKDLDDLWEEVSNMNIQETPAKNLKSDTKKLESDMYAIKNPNRVGVCYIINQVDFNVSRTSIENNEESCFLDSRGGSDKDKIKLEKTMRALNFEVISHRNLDHKKMIGLIGDIIKYRVHPDDSIFMLCIMSHGVKDHVYATDSVLVKVQDIENLIENGLAERGLHDIPKVLILQACQVDNDETKDSFVADGPERYIIRKFHFLTCWATAPELEAFRNETKGSIFIQILCDLIKDLSKHEHFCDILTKVADGVWKICTKLRRDQVPIYKTTLRKKLYLQNPE